jgi:hypothetical protein
MDETLPNGNRPVKQKPRAAIRMNAPPSVSVGDYFQAAMGREFRAHELTRDPVGNPNRTSLHP